MLKGKKAFIINLSDEAKKKEAILYKRAKRTIAENLWDTSWLRKKYPERFDNWYERWEIGDDAIYDPALYPERHQKEENH